MPIAQTNGVRSAYTPQSELTTWVAKLDRIMDANGTAAWTLTLSTTERATSRPVTFERLTSWAGPCSNEIVYRCIIPEDEFVAAVIESGLDTITIEGRGSRAIRRITWSPKGLCQLELHLP